MRVLFIIHAWHLAISGSPEHWLPEGAGRASEVGRAIRDQRFCQLSAPDPGGAGVLASGLAVLPGN